MRTIRLLFTLLLAPHLTSSTLYFDGINCTYNAYQLTTMTCSINTPSRRSINWQLMFRRDFINSSTQATVWLPLAKGNKANMFKLFTITIDSCRILTGSTGNRFMDVISASVLKFGNFPNRCPFPPNVMFHVRNITIDVQRLPFAVRSHFKLRLVFYMYEFNNQPVAVLNITGYNK